MSARDLTGFVSGHLTVVSRVNGSIGGRPLWRCQCSCGGERVLSSAVIAMRRSRSCGCLVASGVCSMKHGGRIKGVQSPEYTNWRAMISRCTNPRRRGYERYGGRGITVCSRWSASFEAFLTDMGTRPTLKHSVDRIDSDKGYSPDNCRWATPTEQAENRRDSLALVSKSLIRHMRRRGARLADLAHAFGSCPKTIRGLMRTEATK